MIIKKIIRIRMQNNKINFAQLNNGVIIDFNSIQIDMMNGVKYEIIINNNIKNLNIDKNSGEIISPPKEELMKINSL